MPEEFGGAGPGHQRGGDDDAHHFGRRGAGISGASAVHMNIFGLHPVVVFGTPEQKQRWLPPLIAGKDRACFGVTEPNTGLNTLKLKTTRGARGRPLRRARPEGLDQHRAGRQQDPAAGAHHARSRNARAPRASASSTPTSTASKVEVREIEKLGRKCVDSNQVFIDGLRIPVEDRVGEEGKGFSYILHGLNPGAHPDRRRGGRPGPRRAEARRQLRQRARRLRPARSARTRASSIRWRAPGWNSRRRT